jgi:beta-lactamase regulating signal transducer with metallopeptidase domain
LPSSKAVEHRDQEGGVTAVSLAALAVVLAGPGPALLARAPRLRAAPRAVMTLWQAVAVAAVLAALGATLAVFTGTGLGPGRGAAERAVAGAALLLTLVVLVRLVLTGHRVGTRLRSTRRRHRQLVDLLASDGDGFVVVEGDVPVAYCLPGLAHGRVVVSRGALTRLPPDGLEAVLAHERAHLLARHDLVLEAFTVLHRAFPRWVSSGRALSEVRLLVEVLADAAARRRCGPVPLARALVALAGSPAPNASMAAGGSPSDLTARIRLLADESSHRGLAAAVYAAAVAVVALPTVFLACPWLTGVSSHLLAG